MYSLNTPQIIEHFAHLQMNFTEDNLITQRDRVVANYATQEIYLKHTLPRSKRRRHQEQGAKTLSQECTRVGLGPPK